MSGVPCYIISWQMQVLWRLKILLQKKKKSESFLITFHEFWGILMELYLCFEKCQVLMQQYQVKLI